MSCNFCVIRVIVVYCIYFMVVTRPSTHSMYTESLKLSHSKHQGHPTNLRDPLLIFYYSQETNCSWKNVRLEVSHKESSKSGDRFFKILSPRIILVESLIRQINDHFKRDPSTGFYQPANQEQAVMRKGITSHIPNLILQK